MSPRGCGHGGRGLTLVRAQSLWKHLQEEETAPHPFLGLGGSTTPVSEGVQWARWAVACPLRRACLVELEEAPLTVKSDMGAVVRAMQLPDSGLEIRDRMWLKITIANAVIGERALDAGGGWRYAHSAHTRAHVHTQTCMHAHTCTAGTLPDASLCRRGRGGLAVHARGGLQGAA